MNIRDIMYYMEVFIILILIITVILFFGIKKIIRNSTINNLRKGNITLTAKFVRLEQQEDFRDIVYVQTEDGRIFKSDRTKYRFSESWLRNKTFTVYLGNDEDTYFVDLEFNLIKPAFIIPVLGKKKIYEEGVVIPTVPLAYEQITTRENNITRISYRLYVQEKEGEMRVFQSRNIQVYNPIWFEENNITVMALPEDTRKYIVDFTEPSLGGAILDHVQEAINRYQTTE